jgi:hypothetical protein
MKVHAERGTLGEVFIRGITNLPDGMIIGIELSKRSSKVLGGAKVMLREGQFSSEPFTNGGDPWPSGTHSVKLYAYFNGAWNQPQNVIDAFGKDGALVRERRDPLLKALDPDLKDSEVIFSYKSDVVFDELSPEAKAILCAPR